MIIGISGKLNSGKDTVGKIIQYLTTVKNPDSQEFELKYASTHINIENSDWQIKKFADSLKDIVCILLGCTREQLEDREFKEKELGEEWFKTIWWIKSNHNNLEKFYSKEEAEEFLSHCKENYLQDVYIALEDIMLTPRLLLQLLGTEGGRNIIHPNIWVNALFSGYKPYPKQKWYESKNPLAGYIGNCRVCGERWYSPNKYNRFCKKHNDLQPDIYPNWITTDLRFPNELEAIKQRNGITIRVDRPLQKMKNGMLKLKHTSLTQHPSETALDDAEFDFTINNDKDISHLIQEVRKILKQINLI